MITVQYKDGRRNERWHFCIYRLPGHAQRFQSYGQTKEEAVHSMVHSIAKMLGHNDFEVVYLGAGEYLKGEGTA